MKTVAVIVVLVDVADIEVICGSLETEVGLPVGVLVGGTYIVGRLVGRGDGTTFFVGALVGELEGRI